MTAKSNNPPRVWIEGTIMDDKALRKNVVELLRSGSAHAAPEAALAGVNPTLRHVRPAEGVHSIWEELEHIRITQEDILRYTLDAGWQSPEWPAGYWPANVAEVTDEMWDDSVRRFSADLEALVDLALDVDIDLTAEIPHGKAHTYLRELLLAADHNAYHFGQIVQTRKLLGDWR
ncbi:MAG: hypothetical protein V7641_4872 [Blastocatellia bacterium]